MSLKERFEKEHKINTSGAGSSQAARVEVREKNRRDLTQDTRSEYRKKFESTYQINTTGRGATRADREAARERARSMEFAQEYANQYAKSDHSNAIMPLATPSESSSFGKQLNLPKTETKYNYKNEPDYQEMVKKGKENTRTFLGETGLLTQNPWKKYVDYMTPDQMDTYYYLQGKYGEGYGDDNAVLDYISSIQADLDKQYADAKIQEARERGEETPVLGVAQNIWESLQAAGGYPAAVLDKLIGREADPNRDGLVNYRIAEAAGEGVKEAARETFGDNATVDFLTDTGLSIGQNIARLPFGAANLFLAGGSAATGGYLDAKERGASDERALISGAATGIAEGAFEKLSLGNLESFKNTPIRSAKDFMRNMGKQMLIEGSEEMATELANTITDKIIMGNKSNYDLAYQNYLDAGMNENDARNRALLDIAQNIGLAGAGGAISGGIMGSGAGALNLVSRTRQGGRSQYNYQEIADAVSDNREDFLTERTYKKGENLRKLAEEYAQMQTNGQEISNYDRGYFGEVLEDYAQSAGEDVWKEERKEAGKQWRTDWKNAIVDTGHYVADKGRGLVGKTTGRSRTSQDQIGDQNRQTTEIAIRDTDRITDTDGIQNAEEISTERGMVFSDQQENENPQTNTSYASQNLTQTQEIEENSRPFGEKGREAYVNSYDGSVALEDYHRAFGRYYDAGRYNTPMKIADQAALTSLITTEQASAAYKAGMQDRNAAAQPQYIQGAERTGGLVQAAETATEQQKTVAENFGKKTGLNFVLTDDDAIYGGYARPSGTVYISVKSDNFLGTLSHELTHFIQDYDAELYRHYADTAVRALMNAKSVSYDDLIRQYTRAYEEQGQLLSREEIVDEIVADATGTFLNDEEFISQIAQDSKNKSIGYKILDFITDMIDAIKSLISKKGIRKSSKGLQEDLETLEIARELWVNALNDAGENYKSGQTILGTEDTRYQLNEFGFEEFSDLQKADWEGSNIMYANSKADIIEFFQTYIQKRGPYKKLYLGKIGEDLGKKIFDRTKVQVTGYNVCLDSYFENSHSDYAKELPRGQVAVTPEMVADLPGIIGKFDQVKLGKKTKMGKPSLIFEKNIDGKRVAVEYVSDKRRQLTTQTMWAHKNKSLAPTSNATSASETTSETARGTAPDSSVAQNRNKVKFQLKDTDSQGNSLNKAQKDYFSDTTVKTDDGKLKVTYHGTPQGGYTIFKDGTYFTENRDYAEKYMSRSSGIYRRQPPENPKPTLYKVYLNIEKPFDTRIPAVREIYEKNFYNEYGGGGILEKGLPDWTDGIDLLDFIQDNELDFDGIVLDEGGYTDYDGNPINKGISYVILNSNQAKRIDNGNPTNDPDIRYQMKDVDHQADVDGLIQENEQLRKMNEYLTRQLTITKDYQPRKEDISRVAGKILKEYESTYNRKTLENNLSRLYEYIRSADHVDGAEVSAAAADIAKAVLNKSERRNTELYDQYKDVLDQLRNTKIFVPMEDRPDLASEGGYQEFRRRNFGKIRFANDGISIDSLYQELSAQHPELFPDTITNPADQAIQLADIAEELRPQVENPYKANMDEAAYILGQEIFDAYFDVRSLPPTKADRMAAETEKVKREYTNRMKQYKAELSTKYNEALSEIRKENYARIQELRQKAEEAQGQQKEYYRQRIKDLRDTKNQALRAQQQRYQESLKNRREQREAANYRRQITKEVLQLKNWLLAPTDKKYIPDAMRGTVAEFLESIDFSSNHLNKYGQPTFQTNLWNDVKDIYAQIAAQDGNLESGQGSVYVDIDPDIVAKLDSLTKRVRNIDRLADMSSVDLRDLKDVVLSMKKSIQDANRLIANKTFQRVEEAAQGFMEQSAKRRDKLEKTGTRQRMDDMLRNGMLDARTYFSRLGPAASTMYDSLREGLDTKIRNTKIAQDYMQELMEGQEVTQKELRQWSGKTAEAKTFKVRGGEIKLTPAQVMSLYVLNKRSQARGHIYNPNGGIKQAPEVQIKKNKLGVRSAYISRTYKPVSVTPTDVESITESLTTQQKAIADGIVKFFTTQTSEWGNEVTMKMYGYKKFKAPNYFPIVSDRNYIATRDGQAVNDISTLKNMGATKATVPHANNPIIIEDIFDVYTRQADQMGSYNAFVVPLSDLQKFYNYKAWAGGSVKEELQRVFGTVGQNYIHQLMVDINGSARQDKDVSDIWMSNMKAASVGGNLRVVIQQPTAYLRASAEISFKYLTEGLATAPTPRKWEMVKKYAPIAQWKDWGYFSVDTGRSMKNIFLGPENLIDRVKDISMAGAGKADTLAWTWLWGAVEAETKSRHKELKLGSEEYYQHVGKRFSEIIDKTQVVDSVLHRTRIMKSKNSLTRMATSFMSEPMKSYDMLYEAIADAAVEKTGKARRKVVRVGASWALSSLATALAAAVIDAFRDKDEDKENKLRDRTYKEKYLAAVGSNLKDNFNPLQFIPYMKELSSIIQGFDPQRTELSWAVDLAQTGRNWYNYYKGESPYTIPYLISDSAKALSKLTGVPMENFMRVIENGGYALINAFDAEELKYQSKRLEKDIRSERNTTEYVSLMMKELLKGNQDLADQIYEDLIEAGIETDKVEDSMKKLLKEDERIVDAAERRMESDLDGFNSIVDDMVEMGYPEELVLSAVNSAISAIKKEQNEAVGETEQEEEEGEEKEDEEEPTSRYSSQDLIYAVEGENMTSFNVVAKEMYNNYIKKGKTSGQARSDIKSAITREYKPLYMDSENEEKLKILNKLKYLKVNGQTLYSQEDFNSWFEESKEKK